MKYICKIICFILLCSVLFAGCGRKQELPDTETPGQGSQGQEGTVTPGSGETGKQDGQGQEGTVTPGSGETGKQDGQGQEGTAASGNDETGKADKGNPAGMVSPEPEQFRIDTGKVNQMLEERNVKEKFLTAMPLNEEALLLECMDRESRAYTFYVLHIKAGEESIQPMEFNLSGEVDCFSCEDGIVLYDTMNHVIVLDHQLEIRSEILIPDFIHTPRPMKKERNYCVLPRNQKILYYMTKLENNELYVGLYETDYSCGESRLIYKLEGPETNLNFLNDFVRICPGYSQKGIFFTGRYYESINSQSKDCVGYLDFDKGIPVVYKTEMQQMALTDGGAVFFDGYRLTDAEYAGKLLLIGESGEVSWMKPAYFKESERVSCDRYGRMLTCYKENGETILNLYKEDVWEKQVVIPYNVEDFVLLGQGQYIMYSYYSQDGLRIFLQGIETQQPEEGQGTSAQQQGEGQGASAQQSGEGQGASDQPGEGQVEQGTLAQQPVVGENPFDLEKMEESGQTIEASYGWTVANFDSFVRRIDLGEKASVDLVMEINSWNACEVGYMVFVDGIPQQYRMGEEEGYLIPVNCEKGISRVTLNVTPMVLDAEKEHTVNFACFFCPGFRTSKEKPYYGNYHNMGQVLPWKISGSLSKTEVEISTDVTYQPIPEEIKEQYIRVNRDGTVTKKYETTLYSSFYQNGTETQRFDGTEDTQLVLFGGRERSYRISLFVDHQPVPVFSGARFIDVTMENEQMAVIDLDFSEVSFSDYSCVYAVLCPVNPMENDVEPMMEKTQSITLFK